MPPPVPVVPPLAARRTVVEPWLATSALFRPMSALHEVSVQRVPEAADGSALMLRLGARPGTGPRQGVGIASGTTYRYGTFGSRLRSADCTGQDRSGVVTGTFTYSTDHSDANRNGLQDNDEIDFEFLCGQPEVVQMTIWTDYDEFTDVPRKITRAVDLRTGTVIHNCWIGSWTDACPAPLAGENQPSRVTPVPGYNSATRFRSYRFDWSPNRVTFYVSGDDGRRILLWDYRGPKTRIPQKPAQFMQNVWHTATWDPFGRSAHDQPTRPTAAYLDSTTVPRLP